VNKKVIGAVLAVVVLVAAGFLLLHKKGADRPRSTTASFSPAIALAAPMPQAPVPGMVTMVDLGATECIPCKMMAPIIEELEKEYQGRAAVVFIDVWKNPAAGRQYGVRAIPTQIFYDAQGKEFGRHEGFMDKSSIVSIFTRMGVK
jgi:thioredoxin 1